MKKQLIFYAFMLTFGIACGYGSVKNSEDTTPTPPQVDKPHKNDLDDNATGGHTTGSVENSGDAPPIKEDHATQEDHTNQEDLLFKRTILLKRDSIDEQNEDLLIKYKDNLEPLKELFNNDVLIPHLTDKKKEIIVRTLQALEISIIKPMIETYPQGNQALMFNIENLEKLFAYLGAGEIYTMYINNDNEGPKFFIQKAEYLEKLGLLMKEMRGTGFNGIHALST